MPRSRLDVEPGDRIVVAQGVALAGLLWPGRPRWRLPRLVLAVAAVSTLAGAALAVLGARPHGSRLTPRVVPPQDAELLTSGPYALSRNPIYAGLLLAGAGWAVLRRRAEPVLAWGALLAVLTVKVRHEEIELLDRFGAAYAEYCRSTRRFL